MEDRSFKYLGNKRSPRNGINPLLDRDDKIVSNAAEKADISVLY